MTLPFFSNCSYVAMKADHLEDVRSLDFFAVKSKFSLKVGRVDMYKTRPDDLLDQKDLVHIADIKVTYSFRILNS